MLGRIFTALICAAIIAGCERAPDPTGEWSAADHDKEQESAQRQGIKKGPKAPPGAELVEITWTQACGPCHGPMGHGDGPNGALVKAPDLTREEWQAKVKDDEIEERIRKGKGLMPPNNVPDSILKGLVLRIRALRGR